jgi:hypothetical protein
LIKYVELARAGLQNNVRTEQWIDYGPGVIASREDFYQTVESNNSEGLRYQERYIQKLLETTLSFDHVLYNIENESSKGEVWENHWAQFVHKAAASKNRKAYVTTMRFDPVNSVRTAMTFRDFYNFVDISQNNQDSRGARGQGHWDNIMDWRQKLAGPPFGPMPMNNEKIYGSLDGVNFSTGTEMEAVDRFWRNTFAGCASSRFHRPAMPRAWGSGLNDRVQVNLKAMAMFLAEFDIFSAAPVNDLLRHIVARASSTTEAYVSAGIGREYAVYFPRGRFMVGLDPWVYAKKVSVRWLDTEGLSWSEPEVADVRWEGGREKWGDRGLIVLKTPGNSSYVALIEVVERMQ